MTEELQDVPTTEEHAVTPVKTRWARSRALMAAASITPLIAIGGIAAANAHKTVELSIDGHTVSVGTWKSSVSGVLDQESIKLGEHDRVSPALDAGLSEDTHIRIDRAQQVTIVVDGKEQSVWTTAATTADILADLSESGRTAEIRASRSNNGGRRALDMPLVSSGNIAVLADGKTIPVTVAKPSNTIDVLKLAGVSVSETDIVNIKSINGAPAQLIVTRVVHGQRTETVEIPAPVTTREDGDLERGKSRVIEAGAPGVRTIVYKTVVVNGKETSAEKLSDTTTKQPVERVVAKGTKAPAPAPAAGGSAPAGVWAKLAQCESGGRPNAVSASGKYHGLYQFSVGTWRSVGGSGLPSQASAAEQTARAQALQARSGWGQWPHCSRKIGVR